MRAAESDLRALAEGEAGTLRVGTFQSVGVRILPRVMRLYVERRPGVEVRLAESNFDDLFQRLTGGELELAFVSGTIDAAADHLEVLVDPYVLLAPAQSDQARSGRPVGIRELARLPLVAYSKPEEGGEAYLRAKGLEPQIVFRSDESGIVQGLVAAGIGYALVPLLTVDRGDPGVAVLEVHGVPAREIALAWHADRTRSPAATAFVEVVAEVAAELRGLVIGDCRLSARKSTEPVAPSSGNPTNRRLRVSRSGGPQPRCPVLGARATYRPREPWRKRHRGRKGPQIATAPRTGPARPNGRSPRTATSRCRRSSRAGSRPAGRAVEVQRT